MAHADTKWKVLVIFFTLIMLGAVGFILWNEHQPRTIFTAQKLNLEPGRPPNLSTTSEANVRSFVDDRPWVTGATVDRLSFAHNTRETLFSYFKNDGVEEQWPKQSELFSSVEVTNRILVDLLNGNMACLPIEDAVTEKALDALKGRVTTLCMVRIPPISGGFAGFITLYLTQPPSPIEFKRLVTHGERLAVEIYEQEMERTTR